MIHTMYELLLPRVSIDTVSSQLQLPVTFCLRRGHPPSWKLGLVQRHWFPPPLRHDGSLVLNEVLAELPAAAAAAA